MNHFDTAQGYGAGRSEAVLGRASAGRPQAFVATKMQMSSAEETRAGVQASRERLGRDCIDLFYIHWPREGMESAPMMEALEEARAKEWIRFIGVSNFSVPQMRVIAADTSMRTSSVITSVAFPGRGRDP